MARAGVLIGWGFGIAAGTVTMAPAVFAGVATAQTNVDSCLIGTWRSDPVEQVPQSAVVTVSGFDGVLLTFDAGGLEKVDYSQSQPLHQAPQGEDIVYTFRGTAEAPISTANGAATAGAARSSTVTQTTEDEGAESFGAPSTTIVQRQSKGAGFLGAFPDTAYQCGSGTLTFVNDGGIALRYRQISGGNPGTQERAGTASTSSSSAPTTTSTGSSSSAASTHDDDNSFPWLPFTLPFVIGGPLIYVWRRNKPKQPEQPKQPQPDSDVVPTAPEPACNCTGTIVIRGRNPLRVCEGYKVTWVLKDWEPTADSRYPNANPVWNIALVGADRRNGYFCDRRYEAKLEPHCSGGGTITATRRPTWTLEQAARHLTLTCTVECVVQCPGQPNRTVTCSGSFTIALQNTQPRMAIVVVKDDLWNKDPGHTAMRLVCGEYDTIFGFYPKNTSPATAVAGFTVESRTQEETSRDDEGRDGLGPDPTLPMWYPFEEKREFWFDISADTAERLRDAWLDPKLNLAKYNLYYLNCTTTVVNLVQENLFGQSTWVQRFRDATTQSPWNLSEALESVGHKYETIRGNGSLIDWNDPFTRERTDHPKPKK